MRQAQSHLSRRQNSNRSPAHKVTCALRFDACVSDRQNRVLKSLFSITWNPDYTLGLGWAPNVYNLWLRAWLTLGSLSSLQNCINVKNNTIPFRNHDTLGYIRKTSEEGWNTEHSKHCVTHSHWVVSEVQRLKHERTSPNSSCCLAKVIWATKRSSVLV